MKYITISTEDLERLMELAQMYDFVVYDSNENTDGEGVWHCDVDFYDEEHTQEQDDPLERFSFNETRDDYKIK